MKGCQENLELVLLLGEFRGARRIWLFRGANFLVVRTRSIGGCVFGKSGYRGARIFIVSCVVESCHVALVEIVNL